MISQSNNSAARKTSLNLEQRKRISTAFPTTAAHEVSQASKRLMHGTKAIPVPGMFAHNYARVPRRAIDVYEYRRELYTRQVLSPHALEQVKDATQEAVAPGIHLSLPTQPDASRLGPWARTFIDHSAWLPRPPNWPEVEAAHTLALQADMSLATSKPFRIAHKESYNSEKQGVTALDIISNAATEFKPDWMEVD